MDIEACHCRRGRGGVFAGEPAKTHSSIDGDQSPALAAGLFLSLTDCSMSVATPRGSSCCATCPPGKVRMVQPRDSARCQLLSVLARSSADLSLGTKAT